MTETLNPIEVHIVQRLRARRLFLQMSEARLAELLGVSVTDLVAIEAGRRRIGPIELMRCAEVLSVSGRYFYLGLDATALKRVKTKPWYRDIDRWFATNLLPHEGVLMRVASRITGNRETAREILQDAYLSLVRDDNWRKVEHPRAYVTKAVKYLAWRKFERARIVPIELMANLEAVDQASDEPDAHELLSAAERRQIILDAIEALPPKCRRVVKLRRLKEMLPADIAQEMGISVSMVEKHLAKGMNLIAKRLGEPFDKRSKPKQSRLKTSVSE